VLGAHLSQRLVELGTYGLAEGMLRGLDPPNAGLALLAGAFFAFAVGTFLASRMFAPGSVGEIGLLSAIWALLGVGFDSARVLGHLDGPGALAALITFTLGLAVAAAHRLRHISWQMGGLLLAASLALGGVLGLLLGQVLRLFGGI